MTHDWYKKKGRKLFKLLLDKKTGLRPSPDGSKTHTYYAVIRLFDEVREKIEKDTRERTVRTVVSVLEGSKDIHDGITKIKEIL